MGRNGADSVLCHHQRPPRRLQLFPDNIEGPDLSGLHGTAFLLAAEKALPEAEFRRGEVHRAAEALQRSLG